MHLIVIGLLFNEARAERLPGVGIVHPNKSVSPNGQYALSIIPSDRYGRSSATYRFLRDGVQVWTRELPYTLRNVVLTNKGIVVGFAYRTCQAFDDRENVPLDPPEFLHIVILAPDGSQILNDEIERKQTFFSSPPTPRRRT